MPQVSVIMGVYYRDSNTGLLLRAIGSILEQTFTDFELLICDDGSSKEACNVLNALAQKDARIRLIRNGNKVSLPQKLNSCLNFAKGDCIARMDDDDYSMPDRFEKQLSFLESHKEYAFAGSNVSLIREGKEVGQRILPQSPKKEDFLFVQPFIHPTLIFRKNALQAVGGYSEDRHCILCEDYDLLLRLYEKGYTGYNLQEILLQYTISPIGKSKRKYHHRINEAVTRYHRFKDLGMLPQGIPYVLKPLIVGLIRADILDRIRAKWSRQDTGSN